MTGVEILAMEEVAVKYAFNKNVWGITFGIILIVFLLIGIGISLSTYDWSNIIIGIFLGLVLGTFGGLIGGSIAEIPTKYETQYKVIVSDEVSMNDFVEKYKIIAQDGRIYTVAERGSYETVD